MGFFWFFCFPFFGLVFRLDFALCCAQHSQYLACYSMRVVLYRKMGYGDCTSLTDLVRGSCGKPTSLQQIFYTGKLHKIYVDASFLFHRTRLKRAASLAVLRAKYAPTNANVASAIMLALFDLKASVGSLFSHCVRPSGFLGNVPVLVLAFEQASNTCVICISCCLLCSPLFLFLFFSPT